MEAIERELFIEASPDVVYAVVSKPEHVKQWWPDDARYEAVDGSDGEIQFGDTTVAFTVVETKPPHTFSFRWTHPSGEPATAGNSLLVTFDLSPSGDGTLLRLTETGFRDANERAEHITGWDYYLPRIAPYATRKP